jgi:hypothetical protein
MITLAALLIAHSLASPSSTPPHDDLTLQCRVHTLTRCDRHCNVCESEHLNVTSPHTKLVEVTGFSVRNVAFHNNVIRLSINNQICRFIPSHADQFFPHLETLRIWSSGLRRLVQADIKGLPQLRELILPLNEIEVLDSDLFQFNARISKLDLSRNKLRNVGLAVFAPVSKALTHVNFNHNECIDDNMRGAIEGFGEKVRRLCPPTMDMLQGDVVFLIEQNQQLRLTIEAKDVIIRESCDLRRFGGVGSKFEETRPEASSGQKLQHVFSDYRYAELDVE